MNDTGDIDALAAEYVLGTLESGERTQALALTTIDPGFVEKIKFWERRLSELHLMVEPIEPDAKIWERIKPKLPAGDQTPASAPEGEAVKPEAADEPTPSGVFDELPAAPAATADAPVMPAAPQLAPPPAPAEELAAESKPAPVAVPLPPAMTPPLIPERAAAPAPQASAARRGHAGFWKALAALMTLIVLAVVALVAAWRFAPERVPPMLAPVEVMRQLGVALPVGPPPRKPAPPESQYDE